MPSKEAYREQLESKSEPQLFQEIVTHKLAQRRHQREPGRVPLFWWELDACWAECCRRGCQDLFLRALEEVRQQEKQHQLDNQQPPFSKE
jgi:hypothetical protein